MSAKMLKNKKGESRFFIRDKKGDARYMFFWRVFIWLIVFGAVVLAVLIAFSANADVRKEEADILSVKIADCLIDEGYVRKDIKDFDIFQGCALDKEAIEQGGKFYFSVLIKDAESGDIVYEKAAGVADFEIQCYIKTEEKQLAECNDKTLYALSEDGKSLLIKIITA